MEIDKEDLKALFDICTHSMDFGSGFLDTDEVMLLRKVATMLDIDVMEATPDEFAKRIVHTFKPRSYYQHKSGIWSAITGRYDSGELETEYRCEHCNMYEGESIHDTR